MTGSMDGEEVIDVEDENEVEDEVVRVDNSTCRKAVKAPIK